MKSFNDHLPPDILDIDPLRKVPPQSIDLEVAILGAILIDKEASLKVMQYLEEDLFYKEAHRKIFSAMVYLFEKGEPIDIMTLTNELKRRGNIDSIGGAFFLTELTSQVVSGANVEYHSNILIEKYILRKIITECSSIIEKAFSEKNDAFRLLDEVESRIFTLYEHRMKKSYVDINTAIRATLDELESYHGGGKLIGVPSGFRIFDQITGGFQKSDLIIFAGRPGHGKTAFALNILRNVAVESDVPVAFFSLEMSTRQLVQRLISSEARVDLQSMRNGSLRDSQWQLMSMSVGKLAAAKMYIDDTPAISVLELRAKARRLKSDKGIGLLIVDYLQLMSGSKNTDSREREISMISGGLKALAKELDIPVIALSQVNRLIELRNDKKPQLSDLRESGSIEQDADLVCFIHRPELFNKEKNPDVIVTANSAEITIAKARSGPTGEFKLYFEKEYTRFAPFTSRPSDDVPPTGINAPIVEDDNPF